MKTIIKNNQSEVLTVDGVQSIENKTIDFSLNTILNAAAPIDTLTQLTATEDLVTWSTGNNATFLGGGSLAATFEKETIAPISGLASYKLTQASGSLNDYIASPTKVVSEKFQGNLCTLKFPYKYDGNSADLKLVVWDDTNDVDLIPNEGYLDSASDVNILSVDFTIPTNCDNVIIGLQVKVVDNGSIIVFGDVELGLSQANEILTPVLYSENDSTIRVQGHAGYGSTATVIPYFSSLIEQTGDALLYQNDSVNGARFTALKDGFYAFVYSTNYSPSGTVSIGLSKNASSTSTGFSSLPAVQQLTFTEGQQHDITGRENMVIQWSGYLSAGDVVRPHHTSAFAPQTPTGVNVTLTAAFVGKLKIANATQTNKLPLPMSYAKFTGSNSRGGTATSILKFDTLAELSGSDFTIVNTTADGTYIQVNKSGFLSISANAYKTGTSQQISITRNQTNLTTFPSDPAQVLSSSYTAGTDDVLNASWTGRINAGDIIRVCASQNPTTSVYNNLTLLFIEDKIQVSVSNVLPQYSESDSSIRVNTANGFGSTATRIQRFSNLETNIGTAVTYSDSATDGARFLINENGVYNITFIRNPAADSRWGISRNASSLTTDLQSLTAPEILSIVRTDATNNDAVASWSGYLNVGDIIRPHTDAIASANTSRHSFTISKVGKPNVTGVDVTAFANTNTQIQEVISLTGYSTRNGNNEIVFATTKDNTSSKLISVATVNTATRITALSECFANFSFSVSNTSVDTFYRIDVYNSSGTLLMESYSDQVGNSTGGSVSMAIKLNPGDYALATCNAGTINNNQNTNFSVIATANASSVAIETQQFSTDVNDLTYAGSSLYTLSTLENAPIGTFITWTYASNSNTVTQTNSAAPTQTPADMKTNGIQIFTRAYNAASTSGNPSRIAIQIGKGLKGVSLNLYKSTAKTNSGSTDLLLYDSATQRGLYYKEYNEKTGILLIDSGLAGLSSITSNLFNFNDITTQNNGYVVINAAKTPDVSVITPLQKNKVTIKSLPSDITSSTNPIASLSFSNLVIGKRYRIELFGRVALQAATSAMYMFASHNSAEITRCGVAQSTSVGVTSYISGATEFVATTSSLEIGSQEVGTAILQGDGSNSFTHVILTELNNTEAGNN